MAYFSASANEEPNGIDRKGGCSTLGSDRKEGNGRLSSMRKPLSTNIFMPGKLQMADFLNSNQFSLPDLTADLPHPRHRLPWRCRRNT